MPKGIKEKRLPLATRPGWYCTGTIADDNGENVPCDMAYKTKGSGRCDACGGRLIYRDALTAFVMSGSVMTENDLRGPRGDEINYAQGHND